MNYRIVQNGSVLIESVVAIIIVAAGAVGMLKLHARLMNDAVEAKVRNEATTLAQAKIDDLRDSMLSSEHFSLVGTTCNAGSRMVNGSDTPIASNSGTYSRNWTITPYCNPTRHQVQVAVAWGSGSTQTVTLNSVIAWNDPAKATTNPGSTGSGGGVFGTPTTATLINNAPLIDALPDGSSSLRNDGTAIQFDSSNNEYSLYVKVGTKFQKVMESSVVLIPLSGLIAVENASGFSVDMTKVNVEGSEAVYCTAPLRFGNQDQPSTYGISGGTPSQSSDKAGAYVCYVPTGWTGTLSLFEKNSSCGNQLFKNNKNGSCNYTEALACPELVDGSLNLSGQRTIRALVLDTSNTIVGQSGVLPGHSTMVMPNYPNLTRTQRLDFVIYKPATGSNPQRCSSIFLNSGSGLSGAVNTVSYSVIQRTGAGTSDSPTYGVPSMRYPHYVLEAYTGNGGFATVAGTLTGTCTPTAVGTGAFSGKDYVCNINSGSYSCQVGIGWSGDVESGANSVAVSAVPQGGTSINFTCP